MTKGKKVSVGVVWALLGVNVAALWALRGEPRKPLSTTDVAVGTGVNVVLGACVYLAAR